MTNTPELSADRKLEVVRYRVVHLVDAIMVHDTITGIYIHYSSLDAAARDARELNTTAKDATRE